MIAGGRFFYLFAAVTVASGVMVIAAQEPRARGAVPDPGVLQCRPGCSCCWAPSSWR